MFNLIYLVMRNFDVVLNGCQVNTVLPSFGSEFNNKYLVVIDGNQIKKSFVNKKPALRWCLRYSVNKNNYVELWYQHGNGQAVIVDFWN